MGSKSFLELFDEYKSLVHKMTNYASRETYGTKQRLRLDAKASQAQEDIRRIEHEMEIRILMVEASNGKSNC